MAPRHGEHRGGGALPLGLRVGSFAMSRLVPRQRSRVTFPNGGTADEHRPYARSVFVPGRWASQWRREHPIAWLLYEFATSVALVALAWVFFGRTVGIFAAGFFIALDLVMLVVVIAQTRANSRATP